jgi:hypothetical protein
MQIRVFIFCSALFFFIAPGSTKGQTREEIKKEIEAHEKAIEELELRYEKIRLDEVIRDVLKNGLPALEPGEEVIAHSAMALVCPVSAAWMRFCLEPQPNCTKLPSVRRR